MKLKHLRISKTYNDATPYRVEVAVEGSSSTTELILSNEAATRIINVLAEEIQASVHEAANAVLDTFPLISGPKEDEDNVPF